MAKPPTKDTGLERRYAEALGLLRESPSRLAIDRCCDKSPSHRYWPWKRRVETFLEQLDAE